MYGNGLGPNNEGPMTGRGMGNCRSGEGMGNSGRGCRGNGRGRGRRCADFRGAGFNRGLKVIEDENNKELLEERKALLTKELEKINEQLEKA